MKWPSSFRMIRHDTSEYNVLKALKESDPDYQKFLAAFESEPESEETRWLAQGIARKFSLGVSDQNTPLVESPKNEQRAILTAEHLRETSELPDVIFLSPYKRIWETFQRLCKGWPELENVRRVVDERIREHEHGVITLYNDWRVYHALNPEQARFYKLQGRYWYRYPQGENVPDVRLRNGLWLGALVRDFAGHHVWAITHHLNILATRANLERLDADEFIRLDEDEKPLNLGVTTYRCDPTQGKNGHLVLESYNEALY